MHFNDAVTSRGGLVAASLFGMGGSFAMPDAKGMVLFLGSLGLGVGAMVGAYSGAVALQRAKTRGETARIDAETAKIDAEATRTRADALAHAVRTDADARAYAVRTEADAHKGTCQEELDKANTRIDELIRRLADDEREAARAAEERAVILDELKDSRHAIVELSQIVLVKAGFAAGRPRADAEGVSGR